MIKLIKHVLTFLLIVYVLMNLFFPFFQEKVLFLNNKLSQDFSFDFDDNVEELSIPTQDGQQISALLFKRQDAQGLILYQHGNKDNLTRWGTIAQGIQDSAAYDILIWDYRTYGKSTGKMSFDALLKDADTMYAYAKELYSEENIVVYGRSIGTGLSTYLASKNNPNKLVLETPYYSMTNLVKEKYWFLLTKGFLRYPFPSNEFIQAIDCPVLMFHGNNDYVIPLSQAEKLFEASPSTYKQFVMIQGGEHNNLSEYDAYWTSLQSFLDQ